MQSIQSLSLLLILWLAFAIVTIAVFGCLMRSDPPGPRSLLHPPHSKFQLPQALPALVRVTITLTNFQRVSAPRKGSRLNLVPRSIIYWHKVLLTPLLSPDEFKK